MFRNLLVFVFLFICLAPFSSTQLYAQDEKNQTEDSHTVTGTPNEKTVDFVLRLGQGGFKDSRSPIERLGGGQLALDVKPSKLPIALCISSEYYTNNANPTHRHEIRRLVSADVLYMGRLLDIERAKYFLGGGIAWLEVPKGEDDPDAIVKGNLYNLEEGVHVRAFWRIGIYGVAKYLSSQKKVDGTKVIDFSEGVILLGVTSSFGLQAPLWTVQNRVYKPGHLLWIYHKRELCYMEDRDIPACDGVRFGRKADECGLLLPGGRVLHIPRRPG